MKHSGLSLMSYKIWNLAAFCSQDSYKIVPGARESLFAPCLVVIVSFLGFLSHKVSLD